MKYETVRKNLIEERDKNAHKGVFGNVLLIAGSHGMAGAAILASKAALRAGSGLVKVCVPEELIPIVQVGIPEATVVAREELMEMETPVDEYLEKFDAVAIGPGLGTNKEAIDILNMVLTNYQGPMVLDADALNIISMDNTGKLLKLLGERIITPVITPHIGEGRRLLGEGSGPIDRETFAQNIFRKTKAVTLLKGHHTIVLYNDRMYVNATGNAGMATGGSGDTLTGIILSLLGQGLDPFDAAELGAYLHGLAGDLAKVKFGEYGLIARDISDYIAFAIKEYLD